MIVGLTGGIGSGKTTAASFFKELGIPVYISDDRAKFLMNSSEILKEQIQNLLGEEAYHNGSLNRSYVASKVFSDQELLFGLNAIVHPAVDVDFQEWYKKQDTPYVIKEAAILFENGGYLKCDYMIVVTAPIDVRVKRVSERDKITPNEVFDRIRNQWSDARKISLSDAVIENISLSGLKYRVEILHNHLTVKVSRA